MTDVMQSFGISAHLILLTKSLFLSIGCGLGGRVLSGIGGKAAEKEEE